MFNQLLLKLITKGILELLEIETHNKLKKEDKIKWYKCTTEDAN
jgi:hypothetical protein